MVNIMKGCEICGRKPPQDNVALFRVNEKGVEGIWRCREHLGNVKVDSEVNDIVKIIEEDNQKKP